jgi:hypothetical protein
MFTGIERNAENQRVRISTGLPNVSFNRVRRACAEFALESMTASKVKLYSPILCIAAATTNRENATV